MGADGHSCHRRGPRPAGGLLAGERDAAGVRRQCAVDGGNAGQRDAAGRRRTDRLDPAVIVQFVRRRLMLIEPRPTDMSLAVE